MRKRVLITGGCGFIGAVITNMLWSDGFELCVIDDLSVGKPEYIPKEVPLLNKSILDSTVIDDFKIFKPDIVIHLAAIHHIPTCNAFPKKALKTNILGSQNIIDGIIESGTVSKVLFASSGSVYKWGEHVLKETNSIASSDVYSLTKKAGEDLFKLLADRENIECVILRLFNVIGVNDNNLHLIPQILQQVKEGQQAIKIGNLESIRSYVDVRDVARAFYSAMNYQQEDKLEVFNISSHEHYSVKDMIAMIEDLLGYKLELLPSKQRQRKNDRPKQVASIEKVLYKMKWKPNIKIRDSLKNNMLKDGIIKLDNSREYFRSRKRIEIDITYRCNLQCIDCNRSVSQVPSKDEMSLEQIKKFVKESIDEKIYWERIRVLGGEPTLHPQFFEIIDQLLWYKKEYSTSTIIEIVSNGYGEKVKAKIKKIKALDVFIDENSYKDGNLVQRDFDSFNVAPEDIEKYGTSNYSLGCWITESCGIGLTPYGYYPCAISGGIDRIFGYDLGRKRLPEDSDEMKDLLNTFCRKCGHFKNRHFEDLEGKAEVHHGEISKTWEDAYSVFKQNTPTLNRY
jgi:nucleoside-diphosphate-sugar epimerase